MAEKHHRDWKRSALGFGRRLNGRCGTPLLLVLLVTGMYWKLVLTNQFTWLSAGDLTAQVLPWLQVQAGEWHAGNLPLWDPYSWGGQPLLGQVLPGSANPLNWLLYSAPLKHGWLRQSAVHWYYVLIRILAALTFYWFCRSLGRSRTAALLGGAIYGTAGYLGSVEWPQMVNGAVWAPLVFLFQFRAADGERPLRNGLLSGFFLGLVWLSGHHQLPTFVSLTSGLLWAYLIFVRRARVLVCGLTLAVALLTSGLQTLPMLEYGRLAQRWASTDHALRWNEKLPYDVHQQYSLKPLTLLGIAVPGIDLHVSPFVGAIVLALAAAGVAAARKDRHARWLAVMSLAGLLFALGTNSVVHGVLYSIVPLLDKARVPAQAVLIFHLGICALAAWGMDLFPALSRRAAGILAAALAAGGILLSVMGLFLFFSRALPVENGDSRFMVTAFAALIGACIMWGWRSQNITAREAAAGLLCLALVEIGNVTGYFFLKYEEKDRTAAVRRMAEDSDVIEYLRTQGGRFRIDYDADLVPHNLSDWWGIESLVSYVASAPDIVLRNQLFNQRVIQMLGVRYYFGAKPQHADQQEIFTGASGRKLFRNPVAFPRAWSVHETTQTAPAGTAALLADSSFDLTTKAIVTHAIPPLESCSGDSIEVPMHQLNEVTINADMRCRGLVILSETYFPGWRATLDGQPVEIHDANGFLRSVVVDAGKHRIEMKYRPASVIFGAAMTALGGLIALFAAFFRFPLVKSHPVNYS